MISYEPFWKTINERKITTYQLIYKQGILPDTMKYVPDTDDKN